MRRDAARVAGLPHDAEVSELQTPSVAHEDVHGCEIAMQHLSAVQPAEHLKDAGDFTARDELRPSLAVALQERAQIAMTCIFECKAVQDPARSLHDWKRVEHANRARMFVEHLTE